MADFKIAKSNINLWNIKSSYIKKGVFSFLFEKQILNIIIYNKELQKMLLIDIDNYKKMAGKYKTGEKNGKGREYLLNKKNLIFEGEYLNGKRNGKGKEYYNNGQLKFEGEYLNGKIWNGKGYNTKGILVFTIVNGKGLIKEYYYNNGHLRFEGEYLNGERNGKGKEYYYYKDNIRFEGEYLNGERNGKGKEYYHNGMLRFEGKYLNGKLLYGREYYNNGNLKENHIKKEY